MVVFRILGPVEADVDTRPAALGRRQQRALLALLVLHANRVVPRDVLVENLWDDPPESAVTAMHGYVSGLRKVLGKDTIQTCAPGYVLTVEPETSDLERFERALTVAERLDPESARATLESALALWRGRALADVDDFPFARTEQGRLEELRLHAMELRIAADLSLGRHRKVVSELESLVQAHPLRERFRELLMVALYRSGRQADALEVYRRGRRVLRDELGLEPNVELKRLERAILSHDPQIAAPEPASAEGPSVERPHRILLAALATLAIAAAVGATFAFGAGHARRVHANGAPLVVPNSLVRISPSTGTIQSVTPVGTDPVSLTMADEAVWLVNRGDRTVTEVDVRAHRERTLGDISSVYDIAAGPDGAIWVSGSRGGFVARLRMATWPNFAPPQPAIVLHTHASALTFGAGELWITDGTNTGHSPNTVSRIDLATGRRLPPITVGNRPLSIAFGFGAAWVSNYDSETISVIRPGTDRPDTIRLLNVIDQTPLAVAVGAGAVWVATVNAEVIRVNPNTERIVKRISLGTPGGNLPLSIAAANGSVWVTDRGAGTLVQINASTNRIRRTIPLGNFPSTPCGVTATHNAIWVTVGSDSDCGTPHA